MGSRIQNKQIRYQDVLENKTFLDILRSKLAAFTAENWQQIVDTN